MSSNRSIYDLHETENNIFFHTKLAPRGIWVAHIVEDGGVVFVALMEVCRSSLQRHLHLELHRDEEGKEEEKEGVAALSSWPSWRAAAAPPSGAMESCSI